MNNPRHPIVPPLELVEKWYCHTPLDRGLTLATWAAQWGADQELEACCSEVAWLESTSMAKKIRARRRPKPPSLKEQALGALETLNQAWTMPKELEAVIAIRRALEALPND